MEKLLAGWILGGLCGPPQVTGRRLHYSKIARGFAALSLLILAGVAVLTLRGRPLAASEVRWLVGTAAVFVALGASMVVEFFGVKHEYDDAGITYRSPWSTTRRIAWAEVAKIEWRPMLKWLDIVPLDDSKRLHLHPMLGGLAPFAKLALQQVPSHAWADQPEAYIALRLMASGHHAMLTIDARKPSQLAADPELQLSA